MTFNVSEVLEGVSFQAPPRASSTSPTLPHYNPSLLAPRTLYGGSDFDPDGPGSTPRRQTRPFTHEKDTIDTLSPKGTETD